MSDILKSVLSIQQPFGMIVLLALIGGSVGVICSMIEGIRKYACHRKDVELKRELVERGLSVDEIERIVYSGPSPGSDPNPRS